MVTRPGLIGRDAELGRLEGALGEAESGSGSLVLLAGEAGIGKTRLAAELTARCETPALWGTPSRGVASPYAAIVAALRSHLRTTPRSLDGSGPLRPHLALLLPELGEPAPATDRATLVEAVRCAFEQVAADRGALVVLDDLQWSDEATLELLGALAPTLAELPVLVVGAYRSDELPREHALRRLRNELRRMHLLDEVEPGPLGPDEVAELLAAHLPAAPSPELARAVHERTQGVPFFVEELVRALVVSGSLETGRGGLRLGGEGRVPVPETVRDAVRIAAGELSEEARSAAEAVAVAGEAFRLDLVDEIATESALAELVDRGILVEKEDGIAGFRHGLVREAFYADLPWLRRRAHHRRLADAIEAAGGSSADLATQLLGAREETRAREALLAAMAESAAVHAYGDAAAAGRQAIDLWPADDEPDRRLEALERCAGCAELAGELAEAATAWREIADVRAARGDGLGLAEAERHLAGIYELQGERERASAARQVAAEQFAVNGASAESAVERLAIANQLRYGGRFAAAGEVAHQAGEEARRGGRDDLAIRALGLEGTNRAKAGEVDEGLRMVRTALSEALEQDLTSIAAELYQLHSVAVYDGADYATANRLLDTALELCRASDDASTETACVTCMAYVLRERGEWARAAELSRGLAAEGSFVASGVLGAITCARGKLGPARRLLTAANAGATKAGHYSMQVDSTTWLAQLALADGDPEAAAGLCRTLLERWRETDDHHYAVSGLRWAAAFLAGRGDPGAARAFAEALAAIAGDTGHAHPLAALSHALGEAALRDGDVESAAEQLSRAVELHSSLEIPYERAQIELRAGVTRAAAGDRDQALEHLADAYRTARKLGARPLAAEVAAEVEQLGESIERHLGRRAAADAEGAGLSRRELEVMRMVATGQTNREIAAELVLSPRTIDMHVRNILRKLECRSRVEAVRRADELGLLA